MRKNKRRLAVAMGVAMVLALGSLPGWANHVGSVSGIFESRDGNLVADHGADGAVDWGSFTNAGVAADWNFTRIDDPKVEVNKQLRDDQYSGGTKQDDDCPSTTLGSFGGPDGSKVDLDRLYLASRTITDTPYLFLGWVRVPQNSQSASSHVAYEFNKGSVGTCPDGDLLKRVEQDMLVVYDFPGGDSDQVQLKVSRWLTSAGGWSASDCEVAKSLPCWGNTVDLNEPGVSDGRVNTASVGSVIDPLNGNQTLGVVEFGEAGINLVAAGVFDPEECEEFGHVTGVSRSSGSSGSAQMKDKVGPAEFRLGNCGEITIVKETDPADTAGDFDFNLSNTNVDEDFTLAHGDSEKFEDLKAGTYTVTEDDPSPEFALKSIVCTGISQDNIDVDLSTFSVEIDLPADAAVTCTFINELQHGRVVVKKLDDDGNLEKGATFTIEPKAGGTAITMTEVADGVFCTDGLIKGVEYTVTETDPPPGHAAADPASKDVTVDNLLACTGVGSGTTADTSFTNEQLHTVLVIVCHQRDDTLAPSAYDGKTSPSAAQATAGGLDETKLCEMAKDLGIKGLGHGNKEITVNVTH